MSRYWVIAPYDSTKTQIYEKVWEYDRANGTIAIGWKELGDVSQLSRSELEAKYKATYGNIAKGSVTRDVNALWAFYHDISPGDVVIARCGTKKVVGIGTVTGGPFYDEQKGIDRVSNLTDHAYSNFLPVKWDEQVILFDEIVFSFFTIYEIPEERYQQIISKHLPPSKEEEKEFVGSAEFILEKYLEDFIVTNFDSIFKGHFKLFIDPEGNKGQQYPVIGSAGLIGRIDILAVEPGTNSFLVIELKKGRESDQVVGQILRYMGWVEQNLCAGGEKVKGLIIAQDVDEKLFYALRMVQDRVKVKRYHIDFKLSDVK